LRGGGEVEDIKSEITFNLTDFSSRSSAKKIGNLIIISFQLLVSSGAVQIAFTVPTKYSAKGWFFASGVVQDYGNGVPVGTYSMYTSNGTQFAVLCTSSTYTNTAIVGEVVYTI
jgi:hypothetical protein